MAATSTLEIIIRASNKASKEFDKVTSSAQKMGQQMDKAGRSLTRNLTLPIVAFGVAATKAYSDFDKSQTNLQARTGATVADMELIRKTAIKMGVETAFSATEASDAMLELMSSGSSVSETMQQLKPVLDLAAAGTLDLKFAADAVTDILAQFRLEAKDSIMVVDSLAAAAQSSSATIEDMVSGLGNAGANMRAMGFDLGTTNAALAVLAEGGKKGAEAGTQLNSMLTKMSSTTAKTQEAWNALGTSMFNAQGQVKDFDVILDDIKRGMTGKTEQEQLAIIQALGGSYGKAGLNILLAADGIDTMAAKMATAQTAAAVAEKQMESFAGTMNQLKGSFQTLMIVAVGPFIEQVLKPFVKWITEVLNKYIIWAEANQGIALTISKIVVALALIGPALIIISKLIAAFMAVKQAIMAIRAAMVAFNLVAMMNPWVLVIMGVAAVVLLLAANWDKLKEAFQRVWDVAKGFFEFITTGNITQAFLSALGITEDGAVMRALLFFRDRLIEFVNNIKLAIDNLKQLPAQLVELGRQIVLGLAQGILDGLAAIDDALGGIGQKVIGGLKAIFQISSPSLVMENIGQNVSQGLVQGINNGFNQSGGLQPLANNISQGMQSIATQSVNQMNQLANSIGNGMNQIQQLTRGGGTFKGQAFGGMTGTNMLATQMQKSKQVILNNLANSMAQAGQAVGKQFDFTSGIASKFGIAEDNPLVKAAIDKIKSGGGGAKSASGGLTTSSGGGLSPAFSATGGGNITITIESITLPEGTLQEQATKLMQIIAKKIQKKKGLSGRSVTQ